MHFDGCSSSYALTLNNPRAEHNVGNFDIILDHFLWIT